MPGELPPDLKMNGHRMVDFTLALKLKRANGMLCKARHFISKDDLINLYYAFFSSRLIYGCQIWGQKLNLFNQKVVKLQNRALRIITFSDFRADSNPLYADLNILKIADHITLQNCLFVHDALNKVSPICFHDYFSLTKTIHSLSTKSIIWVVCLH